MQFLTDLFVGAQGWLFARDPGKVAERATELAKPFHVRPPRSA